MLPYPVEHLIYFLDLPGIYLSKGNQVEIFLPNSWTLWKQWIYGLETSGSNETLTYFVTDSTSSSSLYEPLGSTELLEFTEEQSMEFSILLNI